MGLDSVLHAGDMGDRLGRDGFKINEDWQQSAVNGYGGNTTSGYESAQGSAAYPVSYQRSGHNSQHGQTQEDFDPAWWNNGGGNSNQMS
jgi:hypothetical protein